MFRKLVYNRVFLKESVYHHVMCFLQFQILNYPQNNNVDHLLIFYITQMHSNPHLTISQFLTPSTSILDINTSLLRLNNAFVLRYHSSRRRLDHFFLILRFLGTKVFFPYIPEINSSSESDDMEFILLSLIFSEGNSQTVCKLFLNDT